ncbi:MAG: glyoxalase family protein [Devosia sp.]|nr:glyoxalase family protein [Devosia sp.]
MSVAKPSRATLIPVLRYRDADAALKFLTEIFGFEVGTMFRDEAGVIVHCELKFGNGAVMMSQVADTPFGKLMRQPGEAGGVTMALFAVVSDPDAHYAKSVAAGFEIILPLRDEDYGSCEYSVRDPEGQIWTFGTYDILPLA